MGLHTSRFFFLFFPPLCFDLHTSLFVCVRTHVYVYAHIKKKDVHMRTHVYVYVYAHKNGYTCVRLCVYMPTHVYVNTHVARTHNTRRQSAPCLFLCIGIDLKKKRLPLKTKTPQSLFPCIRCVCICVRMCMWQRVLCVHATCMRAQHSLPLSIFKNND